MEQYPAMGWNNAETQHKSQIITLEKNYVHKTFKRRSERLFNFLGSIYNSCPGATLRDKCPSTEFFFNSYFPVFSPNTGKYGLEKTPHLDTFHAVQSICILNHVGVTQILIKRRALLFSD